MQPTRTGATSGQSITELVLILPMILTILLGTVDLSRAFVIHMNVGTAAAHGVRLAALEGAGPSCVTNPLNDSVDLDIINDVLGNRDIVTTNLRQIQVYRVNPDGSPDAGAINTYVAPFTTTVGGVTVPFSTTGSYNWPPCTRRVTEPSDSVGVGLVYTYDTIVPLPWLKTLTLTYNTSQQINPAQGQTPCPIPGIPTNVIVANTSLLEPPASPNDQITWDLTPGATSYNIYANVNGAGYGSSPVTSVVSGTTTGMTETTTYGGNAGYAPASYEVAGVNYCGEGQHSLPGANGQCPLPATPQILSAKTGTPPSTDVISYTAPWPTTPVSDTYVMTQTSSLNAIVTTIPITPTDPLTTTVQLPLSGLGTGPVAYQMSSRNHCGVTSNASNVVTRN